MSNNDIKNKKKRAEAEVDIGYGERVAEQEIVAPLLAPKPQNGIEKKYDIEEIREFMNKKGKKRQIVPGHGLIGVGK